MFLIVVEVFFFVRILVVVYYFFFGSYRGNVFCCKGFVNFEEYRFCFLVVGIVDFGSLMLEISIFLENK